MMVSGAPYGTRTRVTAVKGPLTCLRASIAIQDVLVNAGLTVISERRCLKLFSHVYWTLVGHEGIMARTLRDASLDSRAARSRLNARGKPYYRAIEEGLHLGYRRPRGRRGSPAVAGKWVVRRYLEKERTYAVETIAAADDSSDADGIT